MPGRGASSKWNSSTLLLFTVVSINIINLLNSRTKRDGHRWEEGRLCGEPDRNHAGHPPEEGQTGDIQEGEEGHRHSGKSSQSPTAMSK